MKKTHKPDHQCIVVTAGGNRTKIESQYQYLMKNVRGNVNTLQWSKPFTEYSSDWNDVYSSIVESS